MAIALAQEPPAPSVRVEGGLVWLDGFAESDPTVVTQVAESDDPVAAVHRMLRIGADAVSGAVSQVNSDTLEATVSGLTQQVERTIGSALQGVTEAATSLLGGEDSAVATTMTAFKTDLGKLLGDAFDPDSKKSVIAKIEGSVQEVLAVQTAKIGRLLDASSPESPLAKSHDAILKSVRTETESVAKEVRDLSEKIAAQAASAATRKSMFDKTTAKGVALEETLHNLVERFATPLGDIAVQTGTTTGTLGTRQGDEVVTVNPDATRGEDVRFVLECVRFVLECKDKKMSLPKILSELDSAMENRSASAGIAVFGTAACAPISSEFQHFGNNAILVIDKDDPDPGVIRLACIWARWVTVREIASEADALDPAKIDGLIDEARRALARFKTIKTHHTEASKGIDGAKAGLDALETDLRGVLDRLALEIDKAA